MYPIKALFLSLLLSVPVLSQAATINLFASLDGGQEVPANASPGTGTGIISFDDVTNALNWNISYSGLTAPVTAAHFHGPAPAGSNGGVQVNIVANSGGSVASPMIGSTTITPTQAADLLAGLWYINIHTSAFPGGEIRGQVEVIPVPAALWLLLSGLAGLGMIARRQAKG